MNSKGLQSILLHVWSSLDSQPAGGAAYSADHPSKNLAGHVFLLGDTRNIKVIDKDHFFVI